MALRKETIKRQFTEALPEVLEPGEQTQAGGATSKYTSPTKPSALRLNVHRWWLDESQAVAAAITSTSVAPWPTDPSAPSVS